MGTFRVTIGVGHIDGWDSEEVSALVDTGAIHSMVPESLLDQMNIFPWEQQSFVLGDNSVIEQGVGVARIILEGRQLPCPVIFGPDDKYLLGATTLEIFNLAVHPSEERLIPIERHTRPI